MATTTTKTTTDDFASQFSHLADDGLGGFAQLTADLVAMPFLRIVQTLSPQLKKTRAEYNPDAEEGFFANSLTNAVYGNSLDVVVGRFDHSFLEWRPSRGGFAGRWGTDDFYRAVSAGTIQRAENGQYSHENGNALSETYTYALIAPEHIQDGIMLFAASSTYLKPARQWNRLLINTVLPTGQRALPYFMVFNLESFLQRSEKGEWYNFKATFKSWVDAPTLALTTTAREGMPDARQIDYSQVAIDVSPANEAYKDPSQGGF